MDLFIGNASRQVLEFCYRVPEVVSLRTQRIEPGKQVRISGDLSPEQVDAIIDQHAIYGMVKESDIDTSRSFHGTCYSVGKPISITRMVYLMNKNMDHLVMEGDNIRRLNAVAQNSVLEQALRENDRPERVTSLDLTIQQENADPANDVPQFSVGTLVTRNGEVRPTSPGTAPRRSRRKAA